MKKTIIIVTCLILVLALAGGIFAWSLLNSPLYTLKLAKDGIQESGLEGLRPYLTENAGQFIEKIISSSGNSLLLSIAYSALGLDEYAQMLLDEIREVEWDLGDTMKGRSTAESEVLFRYKDKFSGSVSIGMVKEGGKWKIDTISHLNIDGLF